MKSERHAAYAVRQAFKDSHAGNVIAAGILPGRKQSPFRAELFALMVAMTASLNSIIFTDCRPVWQGILRLQKEGCNELFWLRSPDSDLWRSAWRILQHPGRRLQVEWLESHRSLRSARGASGAWKIYHNGLVHKNADFRANPLQPHIHALHPCTSATAFFLGRPKITRYIKNSRYIFGGWGSLVPAWAQASQRNQPKPTKPHKNPTKPKQTTRNPNKPHATQPKTPHNPTKPHKTQENTYKAQHGSTSRPSYAPSKSPQSPRTPDKPPLFPWSCWL